MYCFHRRWLNQQLTDVQLGKLPGISTASRFNAFNRPNTVGGMAYPCLTSTTKPSEAPTPLSSNSSMDRAYSGGPPFRHQFPMASPYLSSTGAPISGIPFPQPGNSGFQSGLGIFNQNPALPGSQRSSHIPVTKIAVQASQKVQYNSQGIPAITGMNMASFAAAGQMPTDESSILNTWEDPSSWGAKHNLLPRPQLSFADRSVSIVLLIIHAFYSRDSRMC